jgi:hypothetical protein
MDPVGPAPSNARRRARRHARYRQRQVRAFSPWWRSQPDGADAPPRPLAEFVVPAAAGELVLKPDVTSVLRWGPRRLAARTFGSRLLGHQHVVNRRLLVPGYKPVLWLVARAGAGAGADGVPVAYSERDVRWLGQVGARWLTDAGVRPSDVVVNVLPAGPELGWWQVALGAREAGLSALHVASAVPEEVARFRPTVLVGRAMDVLRLLESGLLRDVHLVLVVGDGVAPPVDDGLRSRIESRLSPGVGGVCLAAWAPPGVRALWVECAGGPATGFHTWPATEVIELVDPLSGVAAPDGAGGEVVWSALGWHGTVLLRLRTGVFATVDDGRCPTCGRVAPRLGVVADTPRFLAVLDRHPDVTGWQAELRTVEGTEELVVFVAAERSDRLEPLLRELDAELSVTQFVVVDRAGLEARLAAHNDARVVDLRTP